MLVYMITAKRIGDKTEFAPELTCSDIMAKYRKEELERNGYLANITQYEVKTQGKNWNTISFPQKFID